MYIQEEPLLYIIFQQYDYLRLPHFNHVQRKRTKCALVIAWIFFSNLHTDCLDLLNIIQLFLKRTEVWHPQKSWIFNTNRGTSWNVSVQSIFHLKRAFFIPCIFTKKVDDNNPGFWSTEFISLDHELCLHCNCERNLRDVCGTSYSKRE